MGWFVKMRARLREISKRWWGNLELVIVGVVTFSIRWCVDGVVFGRVEVVGEGCRVGVVVIGGVEWLLFIWCLVGKDFGE